jgi:hypothetical protein
LEADQPDFSTKPKKLNGLPTKSKPHNHVTPGRELYRTQNVARDQGMPEDLMV